jgi:transglutaminase-like putative cysteine protease
MARLARAGRRDPTVRKHAMRILRDRGVANRDWNGELAALHGWVRDHIRYVRDPVDTLGETRKKGIEMLATPRTTLQVQAGDCDEHATCLSALLGSIGHPSRFAAIAIDGRPFSHVLLESPTQSGTWLTAETTEPVPLGWIPHGVTRRLERYAN